MFGANGTEALRRKYHPKETKFPLSAVHLKTAVQFSLLGAGVLVEVATSPLIHDGG